MTSRAAGRHCYGQYLAGMCLAGLSVCAAGWLVVTALAFAGPVSGTPGGKWNEAAVTTIATGTGLALVAAITFACWATAWRRLLLADGVVAREAGHSSRRHARRARLARARVARERARQERAQRASLRQPEGSVTRSDSEPEPVRPANADRVLSELREQLGPLVTALDTEPPPAAPPSAQDPSAALSPAAPGPAAPGDMAPEAAVPEAAAPAVTAPGEPQAAQEAPPKDAAASLVAICADGVISYDQEEDW